MRMNSRIGILIVMGLLLGLTPALCTAADILVWDSDLDTWLAIPGTPYHYGYEDGIEDALTDLGYEFDTVSVLPTDLSDYNVILITLGVWCTGCGSTPPSAVGTADQARLVEFLEDGNAIYIEGVDFGSDHVGTDFFNHFGTEYVEDYDGFIDSVDGVTPGLMNNLSYEINTSDAAHQQVDVINADGGVAYQIASTNHVSGVFNDSPDGYRTICSVSMFTSLIEDEDNTWTELMARYMSFLQYGNIPIMNVSLENVDFDYVSVGHPETISFTVTNEGADMLEIGSLTLSNNVFSINEDGPLSLDMRESVTIEVTCTATHEEEYNEQLTINSNAPDGPYIIDLHAECIQPPGLLITPSQLSTILPSNGTDDSQSLTLTNNGTGDLDFEVVLIDLDNLGGDRDQGGPDEFGYRWTDSNDPEGPEYVWNDISETGTRVTNWNATDGGSPHEDGYKGLAMGFDFPFYGEMYNWFYLSTNGFLSFNYAMIHISGAWNTHLPNEHYLANIIAPFWDDLSISDADVYIQYNENETVIQYDNATFNYYQNSINMQMILQRGGGIVFYYEELDGSSIGATVGIDNQPGTIGLEVSYNQEYIQPGMAIAISAGPCWLELDSTSGTISPNETVDIGATFSATDLPVGTYRAKIRFTSNDATTPIIDIPATLLVSNGDLFAVELDVSLNSEESPEGAELTLANQNGDEFLIYTAAVPEDGTVSFPSVLEGTYDLHVTLDGYDEYEQTGITVEQDTELDVQLIETLNLPVNLDVEEATSGVLMTWNAPGSRSLQSFNVYLDGEPRGNTTDEQFLWIDIPGGLHTLGVTCVYTTGESDPAEIDHEWQGTLGEDIIPVSDTFVGIYPNPFNPSTTFRFGIAQEEHVVLEIYNVRGQLVQRLDQGRVKAGWHDVIWNGTDRNNGSVGSGIFLVRFKAGSYSEVKRAVMLK